MNTEQFDKIIKDKLAQQHYVPSEEGWNAIQERVAKQNIAAAAQKPISPKGVASGNGAGVFFSIAKIAAVILPLIALWGIYNLVNKKDKQDVAIIKNAAANNTKNIADTLQASLPISNEQLIIDNTATFKNVAITTDKVNRNSVVKNVTLNQHQTILPTEDIIGSTKPIEEKVAENSNTQVSNTTKDAIVTNNNSEKKIDNSKNYLPLELPNTNYKKMIPENSGISVVAGAMINSRNTLGNGFNLGIAAEKNITSKVYVDATVAVSRNNPTWLQNQLPKEGFAANTAKNISTLNSADQGYVNQYGVNPASNIFKAGGNNIAVSELTDDQHIADAAAYRLASTQIEAAPMVGYKVSKKLNIAAGADAVKIFTNTAYNEGVNRLMLQTQNAPSMRNWDMGAVAKVEYKVAKRIIVGYRHREGLTTMTPGSASNTRRNYNGVLVKVKIK